MRARRTVSGIAVGVAVGLLLDGLLLINTSAWLLHPFFMVPMPILGLIIGFVLGWKGKFPAVAWWASLLVVLILWPTAFWGPVKCQEWRLRRFAERLPAYHGADRRIIDISALGGDDPPRVMVEFETKHVSIGKMVGLYRDHLVQNGWTEDEPQEQFQANAWYKLRKGRSTITLMGYEGGGKWGDRQCLRVTRWYSTLFYRRWTTANNHLNATGERPRFACLSLAR